MEVVTPEEKIPRMQGFLESEKPFQENTPNALMPDMPVPVKHASKEEAVSELQGEINYFFIVYEKSRTRRLQTRFLDSSPLISKCNYYISMLRII